MKMIHSEADLDQLLRSANALAAIAAWAKNGYFDALAGGEPRRLEELSGDGRALLITARILAHLGLLVSDGEAWALSTSGRSLLETGALRRGASLDTLADLSRMDEIVSRGGPIKATEVGVDQDNPEGAEQFMEMLYRRSADSSEETARWIARALEGKGHILDVGGGHGRYGRALVERGLEATLFDFPMIIDLARKRHGDALEYRGGSFFEDDLGGPYDGALLSNIVHGLNGDENITLLRRIRASLRDDGLLVLKDMFLDESGTQPESAALFAMIMLNYTQNGNSYTFAQVSSWCEASGFAPISPVTSGGYHLFMARAV
ncbi:MAG: class I SAM-dependent methyltransferase [Bradymonadaceae bacterium]